MHSLLAFAKLGRPKFLFGGFLLFGLGSVLALVVGHALDWRRYLWGQAIITSTQLMTHYSNDFFDLDADRANATPTRWSGGSRVLTSGVLPPRVALVSAQALALCALATSFLSPARAGRPFLLPLALLIIGLSWCYSAPPLRLLTRGLGEITTALVVTLLTPLLGFYLQADNLRPVVFLACLPLCGLQFSMLLTIELPDAAGDAQQGKRTLVVRRGAVWAARCAAGVITASFLMLPLFVSLGLPKRVAFFGLLGAPLGAWHSWRLLRGAFRDERRFESLALSGVALLVATTCAELAGALLTLRSGS